MGNLSIKTVLGGCSYEQVFVRFHVRCVAMFLSTACGSNHHTSSDTGSEGGVDSNGNTDDDGEEATDPDSNSNGDSDATNDTESSLGPWIEPTIDV